MRPGPAGRVFPVMPRIPPPIPAIPGTQIFYSMPLGWNAIPGSGWEHRLPCKSTAALGPRASGSRLTVPMRGFTFTSVLIQQAGLIREDRLYRQTVVLSLIHPLLTFPFPRLPPTFCALRSSEFPEIRATGYAPACWRLSRCGKKYNFCHDPTTPHSIPAFPFGTDACIRPDDVARGFPGRPGCRLRGSGL